jgi:hypothetical protein
MGWDYASELLPLKDILFLLQMIYEYGEWRWNYIYRGKPKNSEKNLSQCHFVHHKFHMDDLKAKPGLCSKRPGFMPGSVNVGFVVVKIALRQGFLWVLWFPLPVSFHHGSPCSYIIWGMNIRHICHRSSKRVSHPIDMNNNTLDLPSKNKCPMHMPWSTDISGGYTIVHIVIQILHQQRHICTSTKCNKN